MDVTSTRCINCSLRLAHMRWHFLQDATEPMVNVLRTWISPTPVSLEYKLCLECYGILQEVPEDGSAPTPMFGHRSVCFACGVSILRAHTHLVRPNCPERTILIRWMFSHLVPHLTKVCTACWLAAKRRNVQIQIQQGSTRPTESLNDTIKREEDSDLEEEIRRRATPSLPDISVPAEDEEEFQSAPKKARLSSSDKETQCNRTDPDELFLLSCAPILKRLNSKQNAGARLKIQQVLYEAEFGA